MGFTPSIPGRPPVFESSVPSQLRALGLWKPCGRCVCLCVCVHAGTHLLGEKAIGVSLRAVDRKEARATVFLTCSPGSGHSIVTHCWNQQADSLPAPSRCFVIFGLDTCMRLCYHLSPKTWSHIPGTFPRALEININFSLSQGYNPPARDGDNRQIAMLTSVALTPTAPSHPISNTASDRSCSTETCTTQAVQLPHFEE